MIGERRPAELGKRLPIEFSKEVRGLQKGLGTGERGILTSPTIPGFKATDLRIGGSLTHLPKLNFGSIVARAENANNWLGNKFDILSKGLAGLLGVKQETAGSLITAGIAFGAMVLTGEPLAGLAGLPIGLGSTKIGSIEVRVEDRPAVVAAHDVVEAIKGVIAKKGRCVVCFSTGGTMTDFYATLREYGDKGFWRNVIALNQDNYVGVEDYATNSYTFEMHDALYDHVGIPRANINTINGAAYDPAEEAELQERTIRNLGGIDILILGIGANAHLGFNEPGTPFNSRTRVVRLTEATRNANARFYGGDIEKVPTQAITIGLQTTMEARNIFLIAMGDGKKVAINRTLFKAPNERIPASVLRGHPNVRFYLDFEPERPAIDPKMVRSLKEDLERLSRGISWGFRENNAKDYLTQAILPELRRLGNIRPPYDGFTNAIDEVTTLMEHALYSISEFGVTGYIFEIPPENGVIRSGIENLLNQASSIIESQILPMLTSLWLED